MVRVNGVEYTPEAVEGIRQELIRLRAAALGPGEFHTAVALSWAIAYLAEYRESMLPACGGCRGEGAHSRHCPRNPDYSPWTRLADMAESLGDGIGPNDMGAANRAWQLASDLRAHAREDIERRRARGQE